MEYYPVYEETQRTYQNAATNISGDIQELLITGLIIGIILIVINWIMVKNAIRNGVYEAMFKIEVLRRGLDSGEYELEDVPTINMFPSKKKPEQ